MHPSKAVTRLDTASIPLMPTVIQFAQWSHAGSTPDCGKSFHYIPTPSPAQLFVWQRTKIYCIVPKLLKARFQGTFSKSRLCMGGCSNLVLRQQALFFTLTSLFVLFPRISFMAVRFQVSVHKFHSQTTEMHLDIREAPVQCMGACAFLLAK